MNERSPSVEFANVVPPGRIDASGWASVGGVAQDTATPAAFIYALAYLWPPAAVLMNPAVFPVVLVVGAGATRFCRKFFGKYFSK